jgi:hypothetical protein
MELPMRADRYTRHGLVLAATAALLAITAYASAAVAGPAPRGPLAPRAASTPAAPGWRVSKLIGPASGNVSGLLSADSAKDAWSVWSGPGITAIEHWNGSKWQRVAVPAKFSSYVRSADLISASSADNVWLFNGSARALRWTGATWRFQPLPSWVLHASSAAVFSAGDVWVFGTSFYAARYNGRSWAKVTLPEPATDVSAVAPDDIWALGSAISFVMHWTGKAWTTVGLPLLPLPAGATVSYSNITGIGPANAWLFRSISYPHATIPDTAVMHWNGKAWPTIPSPADIVGSMANDGSGGLWANGVDINPGGFWLLYHWTGRKWTTSYPPAPMFNHAQEALTWIPGTRSLWSVGPGFNPANSKNPDYGVIIKCGL